MRTRPCTFACALLSALVFQTAGQAVPTLPALPEYHLVHRFGVNGDTLYSPVGGLSDNGDGSIYGTAYGYPQASLGYQLATYKIDIPYAATGYDQPIFLAGQFDYAIVGGSWINGIGSSDLAVDSLGNLYGSVEYGGANGVGVILRFQLNGDDTYTGYPIYTFSNAGKYPTDTLLLARDGNLYGTCTTDGTTHHGLVFQLATYVSLTAPSTPLKSNGIASTTGTVTLAFPAPKGGITITLLPSIDVTSPSTVTVPEGQYTATFPVTAARPVTTKTEAVVTGIYENASHYLTVTLVPTP